MGKTERASFHCACRGLSDRAGAGIFSVVVVLLTAVSPPSRRGLSEIGRPLLCVLRDTVRRRRSLPSAALHHLPQSARDRRTPAARSKEISRVQGRRIPRLRPREASFCLRAMRSLALEFERAWSAEKTAPIAQRSLARSLSVSDRRISPLRLSPYWSGSACCLGARHTTLPKRRRLPKTEMHAGRQRTGNARRLQVAEIVRLRIFSVRFVGSFVSP